MEVQTSIVSKLIINITIFIIRDSSVDPVSKSLASTFILSRDLDPFTTFGCWRPLGDESASRLS